MRYFWAVFLPPIAAFKYGGFFQGLLNIPLTCLAVLPGIIHALMLVSNHDADRRHRELVAAMTGKDPAALKPKMKSFRLSR